jgi:hypothetical protein
LSVFPNASRSEVSRKCEVAYTNILKVDLSEGPILNHELPVEREIGMNANSAFQPDRRALGSAALQLLTGALDTPWIPLSGGVAVRPLRCGEDDNGFSILVRLDPETRFPLHRTTGDAHSFNIEGYRVLASGELVEPADYLYAPAGHVDRWQAIGDCRCLVLLIVNGRLDYLEPDGMAGPGLCATEIERAYHAYCSEAGLEPVRLRP